jgi:hypothetical protein
MSSTDAFATIRRARSLRERHPDAPLSAVLVALCLATFADGKSGTNIRPGFDLIAEITGFSVSTVQRAVRWLERHDELRRDKQGHRGSAACFTFIGGKPVTSDALSDEKAGHLDDTLSEESRSLEVVKPVTAMTPHQPNQPRPSEPSVPPASDELETGEPWVCSAGHVNGQFWDQCDECQEFRLLRV